MRKFNWNYTRRVIEQRKENNLFRVQNSGFRHTCSMIKLCFRVAVHHTHFYLYYSTVMDRYNGIRERLHALIGGGGPRAAIT